jgi:peptidoglycan/LPS O-acetylase OafA/YrhL
MKTAVKPHFLFVDGMRGLAALWVAAYHISTMFQTPLKPEHAYLAVDFFFCLSGFVVASAYDGRMRQGMSVVDFFKRRLIRLYPMIAFAVVLGAMVIGGEWLTSGTGSLQTWLVLTGASFVLFPAGFFYSGLPAYPINTPLWSLAFELLANLIYALKAGWTVKNRLVIAGFMAALAVLLLVIIHKTGTIQAVGFYNPSNFAIGAIRVLYPFLAGVIFWRAGWFQRVAALPDIALGAVLSVVLAMPLFVLSKPYDAVAIVLATPALVLFGARARVTKRLEPLWRALGRLSYPLYLVHMPIGIACMSVYRGTGSRISPYLGAAMTLIVASIAAWLVIKLYDEPVRQWLGRARPEKLRPLPAQ